MRRPVSRPSAADPLDARIERIGAEGDGVVTADARGESAAEKLYIGLTLPGELVRARPLSRRGEGWVAIADAVLEPSADRVTPPCAHFGTCGGCTLQHWRHEAYLAWKSGLLRDALRRAGYRDAPLAPAGRTGPGERRRMDLAVRRSSHGVVVGLHRRDSGSVIDLAECAVLSPALFALVPGLRALLTRLQALRREASVVVNLLDSGPDLLLRTDGSPVLADRVALTEFARAHKLARVAWARGDEDPEPIAVLNPPTTALSGVVVMPPPGAFLQASAAGEAAIVAAVMAAVAERPGSRARVADLYSGLGTIAFALAQVARVAAFDGDAASVAAMRAAVNLAGMAGRVEAAHRDLARRPLNAKELSGFAVVVLDPPYAGAPAQITELAAAKAPVVVYVSCNPGALARDAHALREAGYRLRTATPIDQFLWSARLESVCVFDRGP